MLPGKVLHRTHKLFRLASVEGSAVLGQMIPRWQTKGKSGIGSKKGTRVCVANLVLHPKNLFSLITKSILVKFMSSIHPAIAVSTKNFVAQSHLLAVSRIGAAT